MAKVKLGNRPKSFKKVVKFPMLDGTEGRFECEFKYRTRKEFGVFVDGILEAARKTAEAEGVKVEEEKFSMLALMGNAIGANADYVMQVLDGWDLDVELTRENVEQLFDELPGAGQTIIDTYRTAITEGKLGN